MKQTNYGWREADELRIKTRFFAILSATAKLRKAQCCLAPWLIGNRHLKVGTHQPNSQTSDLVSLAKLEQYVQFGRYWQTSAGLSVADLTCFTDQYQ